MVANSKKSHTETPVSNLTKVYSAAQNPISWFDSCKFEHMEA